MYDLRVIVAVVVQHVMYDLRVIVAVVVQHVMGFFSGTVKSDHYVKFPLQIVKRNVMENIIPIVVSAKHLFEKERSPLLKDLLLYLKELMQDYRNEISGKKFFYYPVEISTTVFSYFCAVQYHMILRGPSGYVIYDIARAFGLCDTVRILATTVCFY